MSNYPWEETRADKVLAELRDKLRITLYCSMKDMPADQMTAPLETAVDAVGFALGMLVKDGHQEILHRLVAAMAKALAHKMQLSDDMRKTIADVMEQSRNTENLLKLFKQGGSGRFMGNRISGGGGKSNRFTEAARRQRRK